MSARPELERLLAEIEAGRAELAGLAGDPEGAAELLGRIGVLVQGAQAELERARQAVRDADS